MKRADLERETERRRQAEEELRRSEERYQEVVEAYLSGLEDLQSKGGDLHQVSSVASFFVSRVDTKIDKLLTARIDASSSPSQKRALERL